MDIDKTLKERGSDYGPFSEQAKQEQVIKAAFAQSNNWAELRDDQRAALEMTAVKISRILTGNMFHYDSWHDIEGYIRLITRTLDPDDVSQKPLDLKGLAYSADKG